MHAIESDTARPRGLLAGYLIHLLLPAFLFADSLRLIRRDAAGIPEIAVGCISGLWLLIGFMALARARDRNHFLRKSSPFLLSFYLGCILFAALEWTTRAVLDRGHGDPLYFRRSVRITRDISHLGMIGVSPVVHFTTNPDGVRGSMPPKDHGVYKIIAVGGSTTECGALDDTEAWPYLVMQKLNAAQKQREVWVGNVGVSAKTSVDHLDFMRHSPPLRQADMLIFLFGVNDLQSALDFSGDSTQKVLEYRAEMFARHAPGGVTPAGGIFRRSWFLMAVLNRWHALKSRILNESKAAETVDAAARQRATAPVVPLPNLDISLREYAGRIRDLEKECRSLNLRCAFLTQPSMWRADLPPELERLLWTGRVGKDGHTIGFASVADLARAMDAYNHTLLDVCVQDRLECYDLASQIPKDTSAFYDDAHFNIGGGEKVADFVAGKLLQVAPFSR